MESLHAQGVDPRLVSRGKVIRQVARSLLPVNSRRDVVLSQRRWVNGLWGTVLGEPPVERDQYRTDIEEFVRRVMNSAPRRSGRVNHLVVIQGQELPQEFYVLVRLLGVPSTVFADPSVVVGEEGTTVEEMCRVFGGIDPIVLDRPSISTTQIHEFGAHFHVGPRRLSCLSPERDGPVPTLTHHETVEHEALDVLRIMNSSRSRRTAVVLPTSDLVSAFRNVLAPRLLGRLQWYLTGEDVRFDERVDGVRPGLRVLTWASATGLDFDTVVLAGLQDVAADPWSMPFRTMVRALAGTARDELWLSYSGEGEPEVVEELPHHLLNIGAARISLLENLSDDEAEDLTDEWPDGDSPARAGHSATETQIAAARTLIESDRRRRRPDKRVLTAEEETGLAQLIRGAGRSLSEALPRGYRATLRPEDERAVAFDTMVVHNQGLSHSVSQKYLGLGLDQADLFQHGVIGLIRAVERFDASKGHKFSTYATWWLRQSMGRALADEGRTVRLPVHMHEQVRKVQGVRARLLGTHDVVTVADISRVSGLTAKEVVRCLRLAAGTFSLDAPVSEGLTLAELVSQDPDNGSDPDQVVDERSTGQTVHQAVRALNARSARVIGLRFGLDGGEPLTLEQIGQLLGVSRERIRQIEKKALEELSGILTEVVTASGETAVQLALAQADAPVGDRRRRRRVRTARASPPVPVPERIAEGTELARSFGFVRPPTGLASLLVTVVEQCLESAATVIGVEASCPEGRPGFMVSHDGQPFASLVVQALAGAPSGGVPPGGSQTVGALCGLFDELELWDSGRAVQTHRRLLLTQAPQTNNWWLHGDDTTPAVPPGRPDLSESPTALIARGPRPAVRNDHWDEAFAEARARLGLVLGGVLDSGAVRLIMDGVPVERRDPFLWRNPSSQDLGTELLYTDGPPVLVTPHVLPHPELLRPGDEDATGPPETWEATQGFYVRSEGRFVSCSGWLGLPGLESRATTSLARVLVEIPSEERDAWGLGGGCRVSVPEGFRSRLTDLAVLARHRSELVMTKSSEVTQQ
jgi:RNA polymerase sigma factor (sigma-70 family)